MGACACGYTTDPDKNCNGTHNVVKAVKADLIKSTVKWGGLEPKVEVGNEGGTGGVRITINLGNSPQDARTIEADTTEVTDVTSIEH